MSDGREGHLPGTAPASVLQQPGEFESFYANKLRSVVELAYALSGSRVVAEDLAQDAFVAAWGRWDRFESYQHAAACVRRVATNLAVSAFRRRLVESRALLRLRSQSTTLAPLPEPHAEFWRAVRRLPSDRRRSSRCSTWRICR